MRPHGFVEITPALDIARLRLVVEEVYRASLDLPISLALRGVAASVVDGILDAAVDRLGIAYRGVRYLPRREMDGSLIAEASTAEFVIASSEELTSRLADAGIARMGVDEGLVFLRTVADRPARSAAASRLYAATA